MTRYHAHPENEVEPSEVGWTRMTTEDPVPFTQTVPAAGEAVYPDGTSTVYG